MKNDFIIGFSYDADQKLHHTEVFELTIEGIESAANAIRLWKLGDTKNSVGVIN